MKKNIAIVGSGFLGMTLALRLADAGAKVTIFESGAEIGGPSSAWQMGDMVWDKHHHVILGSDENTISILKEIGLGDELRWTEAKTGLYSDGQLLSMSDAVEFLRFEPLDLISKIRLGMTIVYASRLKDRRRLENIKVEKWLTRLSGRKAFEKIWKPLLMAKLGEAYKETAASFICGSMRQMLTAGRSDNNPEMFGYVRGGNARVLERFCEVLAAKGVQIRLNSEVESIERSDSEKIRVTLPARRRKRDIKPALVREPTKYAFFQASAAVSPGFSGAFLSEPQVSVSNLKPFPLNATESYFDEVILVCPSNAAAKMLPQITATERQRLADIRYQGVVCASVMLKRRLSNYYITCTSGDTPFTAVTEMSAIVEGTEFNRNALVYLTRYAARDHEMFDKTEDEIREIFLIGLEKMYPKFIRGDVVDFKVSRVRQVFSIPVVDHSRGPSKVDSTVKDVFIVNSSHIVDGTLNINEAVQLAENFFVKQYGGGLSAN